MKTLDNAIQGLYLAGDQGFEPRLTVPETAVLPLDESPMRVDFTTSPKNRQFFRFPGRGPSNPISGLHFGDVLRQRGDR